MIPEIHLPAHLLFHNREVKKRTATLTAVRFFINTFPLL
jgi:hypothetical protein